MTLRFYMHQPDTIFAARIDEPSAVTYPVQDITFETVTTGAFGDIKVGMTVLFGSAAGLDDYGRNRVRAAATSTILKIGRSSIGTRDGEVNVVDAAYITVLNDYRIWSKVPYIDGDDNGAMYKDGDIEVGTNTTTPPPVANAGPPAAGTIDPGDSKLTVTLPPYTPNNSFATADGASISSYAWVLPASGVALAGGSVLTDAEIQIECDPGFYWIELTVTDDNAKSHTARTFVYARDPDADDTIGAAQITEHRVTRHGQTLGVRITQAVAQSTYLDGSICLLMDGEPESQAVRRNILFWGWGQTDPASIVASREATLSETTIKCVDVGGRLDTLPGFTQAVYNDGKRLLAANPTITWAYMTDPNWDKLLHYVLHWHSTSLELTDWVWTGVGATFPFTVREAGGASLFDQVNTQCESLCPAHYFTCDRQGLLACPVDPMLQETGDRTSTVQANIPVSNWSRIKYTHQRPPKTHWLDDSAIIANELVVNAIFAHAPGDAPGQGEMRNTHGEQIAVSQTTLNQVTGHRYARMNAPESLFTINLTQDQDNLIDPAAMEWTTVTITAALAAERGLAFTEARGLVAEMSIRYKADRESVTRSVTLLWERETIGLPAVTVIPPEIPSADDYDPYPDSTPDFVPPDLDDEAYGGSPTGYLMWNKNRIFRTWDIASATPTWEIVTYSIDDIDAGTNYIFDIQYTHDEAAVVGAYLLTDIGLYRCDDIMATAPLVWSLVLSNATISATEDEPPNQINIICSFTTWGVTPGFVVVSTGCEHGNATTDLMNYKKVYFWHSHDYGQTWTTVEVGGDHIFSGSAPGDGFRSFALCQLYNMAMYRDLDGIIYCGRMSSSIGTQQRHTIFISTDQGHTWAHIDDGSGGMGVSSYANKMNFAVTHPYPDRTSTMTVTWGNAGVSGRSNLNKSNSEFGDRPGTQIVTRNGVFPVGYGGLPFSYRPNTNPFDDDHLITLIHNNGEGSPYPPHMMETLDGGVSWQRLGSRVFGTANWQTPEGTSSGPEYSNPNGWPGNNQWWAVISHESSAVADCILVTDDNWATDATREGNIATLLGGGSNWPNLISGGFALPKVGPNA